MRLIQYLVEARQTANAYQEFSTDFKAAFGKDAPAPKLLLGLIRRRPHSAGRNPEEDFATDWFVKRGYLTQQGKIVAPTPKGSELRQSLSAPANSTVGKGLSAAANDGFKALRKYFMDVTDENVREYLQTLDEPTLQAIAIGRELEQEDIAILNGIRDRAENHRERGSYVQSMKDKNPTRLARLETLGFIDAKGSFNKGKWDSFVATISNLDPARIKTLIPSFYQWSTHSSGNTAKNVNRILFAIHPSSRNVTEKGRQVWDMIKTLPDATFASLKGGKKPRQGELSDEAFNLLTTVVASVVRSFPDANSAGELIQRLDDEFASRVDFKSLDRSGQKTSSRRDGVANTFNRY